ncbi:hypothetical protein ABIE64_000045 [Thalassospira sp. MBR-102]
MKPVLVFVLCVSNFIFLKPVVSGENDKVLKSLSSLAGMADYCIGMFGDANDLQGYNRMMQENARISQYIASLLSSEGEADLARAARLDGLKHYQKSFSNDLKACRNLIRTLSLYKTN